MIQNWQERATLDYRQLLGALPSSADSPWTKHRDPERLRPWYPSSFPPSAHLRQLRFTREQLATSYTTPYPPEGCLISGSKHSATHRRPHYCFKACVRKRQNLKVSTLIQKGLPKPAVLFQILSGDSAFELYSAMQCMMTSAACCWAFAKGSLRLLASRWRFPSLPVHWALSENNPVDFLTLPLRSCTPWGAT